MVFSLTPEVYRLTSISIQNIEIVVEIAYDIFDLNHEQDEIDKYIVFETMFSVQC